MTSPSVAEQVRPRWLAPEVVQTSAMDCGPAALKCLLEGFGIPASYPRLREACQTDVDGTSINTLEDVALQLGLEAEQMMAPADHLLQPAADLLPALVVTVLPNGFNHFVVAWRIHGPFVQLMDPAVGRRWVRHADFLEEVYRYTVPFAASAWRAWAATAGFVAPLRSRLHALGLPHARAAHLIKDAAADPSWRSFGGLDAATRMVNSMVVARGLRRGVEATRVIEECYAQARDDRVRGDAGGQSIVPTPFWSVQPASSARTDADDLLLLRGAVLLKITRSSVGVTAPGAASGKTPMSATSAVHGRADEAQADPAAAKDAQPVRVDVPERPTWEIWRALRADGFLTPGLLAAAALLAAAGVTIEAVLLQGLMAVAVDAELGRARLDLLGGVLLFVIFLLLLELPIAATVLRMGRRLETRVRIAFLEKLPRLGDRYFHSRLISDMAQRAYGLHQLHTLPELAVRFLRLCCQLALTTAGIIWIYPAAAPLALAALVAAVAGVLLLQPLQTAHDMRVRTHSGALSRFYLDALMGVMPVRTHSAGRAVRREHEMLVVAWARESLALARSQALAQSLASLTGIGFAVWIIFSYIGARGEAASILLLLYWTLNLPVVGQSMAASARQYPTVRNSMSRILEPLGAPEEEDGPPVAQIASSPADTVSARAATVELDAVTVVAGGNPILEGIDLSIAPGEHVAIVGASGAGKSSLVGLLLGWHRPAAGTVCVDGAPLTGARVYALRRETAWVDPSVQLWNRTLQENLAYGNGAADGLPLGQALQHADLYDVLERLPVGLQTKLGEGGGLVSGGEGQRVRLGRALLRPDARLAILDEPFRGLDRAQRRELLAAARDHWSQATLLCITHDIGETLAFNRVLVIDEGCIVEDGVPAELAARSDSRYREMLEADAAVQATRWRGAAWQRMRLDNGALQVVPAAPASSADESDGGP